MIDNCLGLRSSNQTDSDGDGVGDLCDRCDDGVAADLDGDGTLDYCDACPSVFFSYFDDDDNDCVSFEVDNCLNIANPGQVDSDGDGLGDACDYHPLDASDINDDGILDNPNWPMHTFDVRQSGPYGQFLYVDLDGDRTRDIVVPAWSGDLHWLAGRDVSISTIWFDAAVVLGLGTGQVGGMASGDVDGDGLPEVMLTSSTPLGAELVWYANTGGGTLGPANVVVSRLLPQPSPLHVAADDLDGDGDVDVVWSEGANGVWWSANTAGVFGSPVQLVADDAQNDLQLADLDGDGLPELLLALDGEAIWYQNTGGSYARLPLLLVNGDPQETSSFDMDGDGDLDVLVANTGIPSTWHENLGGLLGPAIDLHGDALGTTLAIGDTDADGDLDLVVGQPDATYLFDNVGGVYQTPVTVGYRDYGAELVLLRDLDADGDADLFGAAADGLRQYLSDGDSTPFAISARHLYFRSGSCSGLSVFDVDQDGLDDILLPKPQGTQWLRNQGLGTYGLPITLPGMTDGVMGDIDGDGWLDVAGVDSSNLSYKLSVGGVLPAPSSLVPVPYFDTFYDNSLFMTQTNYWYYRMKNGVLADLDDDGDLDFFYGGFSEQETQVPGLGASQFDICYVYWFEFNGGGYSDQISLGSRTGYTTDWEEAIQQCTLSSAQDWSGAGTHTISVGFAFSHLANGEPSWDLSAIPSLGASVPSIRSPLGIPLGKPHFTDIDGVGTVELMYIDNQVDTSSLEKPKFVWAYPLPNDVFVAGWSSRLAAGLEAHDSVQTSGDLTGNGFADVLVGGNLFYNEGGSFSPYAESIQFDSSIDAARFVDMDGDGDADILACDDGGELLVWYENTLLGVPLPLPPEPSIGGGTDTGLPADTGLGTGTTTTTSMTTTTGTTGTGGTADTALWTDTGGTTGTGTGVVVVPDTSDTSDTSTGTTTTSSTGTGTTTTTSTGTATTTSTGTTTTTSTSTTTTSTPGTTTTPTTPGTQTPPPVIPVSDDKGCSQSGAGSRTPLWAAPWLLLLFRRRKS